MRKLSNKLIILVLVSFMTLSCSKTSENIKVGVILPMTGPLASGGQKALNGIELAVIEANKLNNFKIDLIVEDSKASPSEGVKAANKLINLDNVEYIIGDLTSGVTLAIAPIADSKEVILLAPGASSPKVRYAGEYIFRNWVSDDYDGKIAANYIKETLNVSNVAILYIMNEYGVGLKNAFSDEIQNDNIKIIMEEGFRQGQTDFRTILQKLNGSNPEAIYIAGQPKELGYILNQMHELKISGIIFSNASVEEEDFKTIVENLNYEIYYTSPVFDLESKDSIVANFVHTYIEKFDEAPDVVSAHGYDAAKILLSCINESETSSANVKDCLYSIKQFHGVTGITSFDKYGDAQKNINVKRINQNRKSEIIKTYHP